MKGFMYILECVDGSYYVGSTKNLETRFEQHQKGEGANYTKIRLPVKLVYVEEFNRVDLAFYREKQVQGWSRVKKESLINSKPELLHGLSECKNDSHFKNAAFDSAQAATNTQILSEKSDLDS
jgi:putative endonuclease